MTEVEAKDLFVAGQWIDQLDDEIGCDRDISQLRLLAEKCRRQPLKASLVHVRFDRKRGNQAAHELNIGINVTFQLRAYEAYLSQHVPAEGLPGNQIVLVIGEEAENGNDH